MSKIYKQINSSFKKDGNYFKIQLTMTSRVIAGWAITLVGLIKLWTTEDPASWWPILMGGTGLMIVSRGVDHFLSNQEEKTLVAEEGVEQSAYMQHAEMDVQVDETPSAVRKSQLFKEKLPL